jgi:hypothetical protein
VNNETQIAEPVVPADAGRASRRFSVAFGPARLHSELDSAAIHMTGDDKIRSAFVPIAGLPCWQAVGEFGTYLTFHFGTPKVVVTEPSEAIRHRRLAGVEGQYVLRLEASQWVAFQDGGKVAHSESPREDVREAAARLQGQKLIVLTVCTQPAGGEFVFDLGGRVAYQVRGVEEETLWTFSTRLDPDPDDADIVSFTSAGRVSLCTLRGNADELRQYVQQTTDYVILGGTLTVQLGASANGGPPEPLANSCVGGEPPSVS